MEFLAQLTLKAAGQVWTTFLHNWPFLLIGIITAVFLKLYLNPEKVSAFLIRYRRVGIAGATIAAVTTPFCSCGTTAVLLGMMASTIPWAPMIAFMVASPLTSPEELIYSAGLFGWPFAVAFFLSSIVLGLVGGLVGEFMERRGWLANQARYTNPSGSSATTSLPEASPAIVTAPSLKTLPACACDSAPARQSEPGPGWMRATKVYVPLKTRPVLVVQPSVTIPAGGISMQSSGACACSASQPQPAASPCSCERPAPVPATTGRSPETNPAGQARPAVTWRAFLSQAFQTGRQLLVMFFGFAFIGYLLNGLIPQTWVSAIFGPGNIYSVPLAATLGLPFYINTEASLPLVRALIEGGMSQGAAMAFLITGAGTSIGAVAGAFTIARWRVVVTVIGVLWAGAIAMGFLVDLLHSAGLL